MRNFVLGVAIGLASLAAGCVPDREYLFYREGVGTDLYVAESIDAVALQDLYLTTLCRLAYPGVGAANLACIDSLLPPDAWPLIVQAGLNDIDQRCDAYLTWLDEKRRTREPILKQIADMNAAAAAIMAVTGVGPAPIAIVAAAFGLAANTFTNIRSRLLFEINHTTVQTVVLRSQQVYRLELARKAVADRPAAIHALRSYLRLCMPFTIETEINNTVTIAERAGPDALRDRAPLIDPVTVPARPASAPLTARQTIAPPERAPRVAVPNFYMIVANYDPKRVSEPTVRRVLRAICADSEKVGKRTNDQILIFEAIMHAGDDDPNMKNGVLDRDEINFLINQNPCPSPYANYYERELLGDPTLKRPQLAASRRLTQADLVRLLNKNPGGGTLPEATALNDQTRKKVEAVRANLGLASSRELAPDLIDRLRSLQ